MRIAIFGRSQLLYDAALELKRRGYDFGIVVTSAAEAYYSVGPSEFRALAHEAGAAFFETGRINSPEMCAALRAAQCDVAVSINWQSIVGAQVIASFPHGVLNVHAGDLPRYRGNAPANWAILNGEPHIGLCLHQMEPGELDSGPVLRRARLPVDDNTYIADVYSWLETTIPQLVADGIDDVSQGKARFEIQSAHPPDSLRCYPRRPEDGRIDWNKPAPIVHRLVRASSRPFAGAFTSLEGREKVTIWRADIFNYDVPFCAVSGQVMFRVDDDPIIACGEGTLRLTDFTVEGDGAAASRQRVAKSLRNRLI